MEGKSTKEDAIKAIVELSTNFEEADKTIVEYFGFKTTKEKIAWVKENFDVQILFHEEDTPDDIAYQLLLTTVIEAMWL